MHSSAVLALALTLAVTATSAFSTPLSARDDVLVSRYVLGQILPGLEQNPADPRNVIWVDLLPSISDFGLRSCM